MTAGLRVARDELRLMLRAPVVYIVGGLFLVVQGVAFAALVGAMSDPRRPAPLGALLENQLAGTLLTWVLELVVLALLGMRSVAEDKRAGGWELLLTAQVGEGAAIAGKWLAAVCVYALLWLPTLAYFAVVAAFRDGDGGWDLATIACGYAGAIAIGAALLAWAIAASAATSSSLAAGALAFAVLIGIFLVGELPAVWPDLAIDHATAARVVGALSLRAIAAGFARGDVGVPEIVRLAGLTATGLSLAVALGCAGRRRRREVRVRIGATIAVAAIAVCASVLAARHPLRWDVSADRRSALDPATRGVIDELPAPATLTIVAPTIAALEPLYAEVDRVAMRMAEVGPVTVRHADPVGVPGGLAAIARAAGVAPGDLASNGAVIVEVDGRRRVVDRLQLATFDTSAEGPPIEQLAIEQAIAGALAAISAPAPIVACVTTGHGELPIERARDDADWALVADRLRGDGVELAAVEPAALAQAVPARCAVLLVIGPMQPLARDESLAIQSFEARGGGLLVAAAARPMPQGGLAPTGLEALLAPDGLGLPPAIAVDPSLAVRDVPGALLVVDGAARAAGPGQRDGYADHPIVAGFAGARATLWYPPRVVAVTPGRAEALVSTSPAGWGERDLVHAPPVKDEDDLAGPVALAAASRGGHRVVAIGSAESMSTALLAGGASAGDLFVARAVRWLAGRAEPDPGIGAHTPAQVRLVMTDGERRAVIAACVGGVPLAWGLLGGLLVWWRRRRAG